MSLSTMAMLGAAAFMVAGDTTLAGIWCLGAMLLRVLERIEQKFQSK